MSPGAMRSGPRRRATITRCTGRRTPEEAPAAVAGGPSAGQRPRDGGDPMADAADRAVTAYFDSAAQAEQAAQELLQWDKDSDLMKLGAVGVLTTNARGEFE